MIALGVLCALVVAGFAWLWQRVTVLDRHERRWLDQLEADMAAERDAERRRSMTKHPSVVEHDGEAVDPWVERGERGW